MISQYTSPELFGSDIKLRNVIPANSVILAVVIHVYNDVTGTVTLQTEAVDESTPSRILYIDYITGKGIYTGNSAKEYFISEQNLLVKNTGSVNFKIKIIFWETE